jgi:uncharacterized membrane protein
METKSPVIEVGSKTAPAAHDGAVSTTATRPPEPPTTHGGGLRPWLRVRSWTLVVWTAMLIWSTTLFALLRADFESFLYVRFDLGNMTQAVWSTAHGRPLEMTNAVGEQVSRLSFHVDPILALLAPFWLVAPSPLTLAGVQIAACALGALPLFWLGRRHLESEIAAAMLAVAYLAYPWLAWNVLDAMHPVTIAIPLILFAIWFLDSDLLWAFALVAVLALLCGELIGLVIGALGIWYWLSRGRRSTGLVIAASGFVWSLVAVKVIVPMFAEGPSVYYAHFEAVGGSPEGVVRTAFTNPGAIVSELTSSRDLVYLALIAAPLAFLPALAPGLVAVALPQLLAIGLSDRSSFVDPRAHYSSVPIAVLVAATVFGIARLPAQRRVGAAALVLVLSAAGSILSGPPGPRGIYSSLFTEREFAARVDALREATALIPPGAPVTSTHFAGSHLSARRYYYSVPRVDRSEWIVVETSDAAITAIPVGYWSPVELQRFVEVIRANKSWRVVFDRDGVLVFRRIAATGDG